MSLSDLKHFSVKKSLVSTTVLAPGKILDSNPNLKSFVRLITTGRKEEEQEEETQTKVKEGLRKLRDNTVQGCQRKAGIVDLPHITAIKQVGHQGFLQSFLLPPLESGRQSIQHTVRENNFGADLHQSAGLLPSLCG